MTTPSERGQTSTPEYEPRTEGERVKNKSNNRRFRNLVEIPTRSIAYRRQKFEKKDSQESYSIINVNLKKSGAQPKYEFFPDSFNYYSSILEVKVDYKITVKYYFNQNGQAMKIGVDTRKGDNPPYSLTPEDYMFVDKVLVNIESGEYKTPF